MPRFDTPGPITVHLDVPGGEVTIVASDRTDTVVDVHPGDDEEAVSLQVGYADGELTVTAAGPPQPAGSGLSRHLGFDPVAALQPQSWGRSLGVASWGVPGLSRLFGDACATARVRIELPSGSHVRGEATAGEVHCSGRLGDCRLRTDHGDLTLGTAAAVDLATDSGEILLDRATGPATITTSSGEVRAGTLDGPATIRNDDGETYVGEVTGDLRLSGVNGDMYVTRAHAGVEAQNVHGAVHVLEVTRGSVTLTSVSGDLEIGVREGTAAWLDAATGTGTLHNSLRSQETPDSFGEQVRIHARTQDGDITVTRA
ncbi:DUF4097 domain-containing protein [Actinomadura sp. ATCC 31491]|uniref:DUF4097 domain-containing protein n=1 Tax=Actinomadura luzonensis TaxID=2805427 RepID=A0ABT0G8R4_9ACTN|nr:DUF4097 domain-containing protein [Actinomadura luzonensis]MCK2220984.1 DUF4097 domain-containing protein [Actinomadura luzonensis]